MESTDLLELITKDESYIYNYLADVSVKQFIIDVKNLLKNNTEKELIKQAINKLQALL
jgi:hypothetical protein